MAEMGNGVLLVTSAEGSVFRSDGATWTEATALADVPLTGVCLGADGTAYAVGAHAILASSDFGATRSMRPSAPEVRGQASTAVAVGYFYLGRAAGKGDVTTVACPSRLGV